MRKKKGIPAGFRKNQGSFLRSFLSDAIDTAQEAFDEFMERDFVTPQERQEAAAQAATKEQPKDAPPMKEPDTQQQQAQQAQQARDDEVAEQIKSLTQTVAALAKAVATMKEAQEQEWQEIATKKRGETQ